jgi:cation transport ATPase
VVFDESLVSERTVLSTLVVLGLGWQFHIGMLRQARSGAANMDTLISLANPMAFLYEGSARPH